MATRYDAIRNPKCLKAYLNAVKALKARRVPLDGGGETNEYDRFVALHLGITGRFDRASGRWLGDGGHGGPAFLPWHREYLRRLEQRLQSTGETLPDGSPVTIPYWDWTNHEGTRDVLFTDQYLGPRGGGDGFGEPVSSGPFTPANGWPIDEHLHVRGIGQNMPQWPRSFGPALRRARSAFDELATDGHVREALNAQDYAGRDGFRPILEAGEKLHNFGHVWVGGSMVMMSSPNDPIFFLHHANVDRIWAAWQRNGHGGVDGFPDANSSGDYRYGHRLDDPLWPWDGGEMRTVDGLEPYIPEFRDEGVTTNRTVLERAPPDYASNAPAATS